MTRRLSMIVAGGAGERENRAGSRETGFLRKEQKIRCYHETSPRITRYLTYHITYHYIIPLFRVLSLAFIFYCLVLENVTDYSSRLML